MKAIVVGGGITGISAALWLQRDGWEVTLIDKSGAGSPDQTSFGNGGILARCAVVPVAVPGLLAKAPAMLFDKSQPLFLRWSYLPRLLPWLVPFLRSGRADRMRAIAEQISHLTYDSVDQHRKLSEGTGAEPFLREGDYSYVYSSSAARDADAGGHALRQSLGMSHVVRDRAHLASLDPLLAEEFQSAVEFADHGWITDPGAYVAALTDAFLAQGGITRPGEVVDISGPAVTLKDGARFEADKLVLAAGIWSRPLAEKLGIKVPMESERGYHLMLHGTNHQPPHPYMIAAGKFVLTPMQDGIRLAGVVEFGGLNAPPSQAPLDLLRSYVKRVYPDLTWQRETVWMGHRPSTVDSLPLLGEVPGAPGVIAAFGSQHIGLTIGPRLGRMVADIAAGREGNSDLSAVRPDRFT